MRLYGKPPDCREFFEAEYGVEAALKFEGVVGRVVADICERAQEDFVCGEARVDVAAPAFPSEADEPGAGDFFG